MAISQTLASKSGTSSSALTGLSGDLEGHTRPAGPPLSTHVGSHSPSAKEQRRAAPQHADTSQRCHRILTASSPQKKRVGGKAGGEEGSGGRCTQRVGSSADGVWALQGASRLLRETPVLAHDSSNQNSPRSLCLLIPGAGSQTGPGCGRHLDVRQPPGGEPCPLEHPAGQRRAHW